MKKIKRLTSALILTLIFTFNYIPVNAANGDSKDAVQKNLSTVASYNKSKLGVNSKVYYVSKGKSYHTTNKCKTLSRSKTIKSGKLQDVKRMGKSDPCNICVR